MTDIPPNAPSGPIVLQTEEPQKNKVRTWELYWFHKTDPDATYRADARTLEQAGYVPLAEVRDYVAKITEAAAEDLDGKDLQNLMSLVDLEVMAEWERAEVAEAEVKRLTADAQAWRIQTEALRPALEQVTVKLRAVIEERNRLIGQFLPWAQSENGEDLMPQEMVAHPLSAFESRAAVADQASAREPSGVEHHEAMCTRNCCCLKCNLHCDCGAARGKHHHVQCRLRQPCTKTPSDRAQVAEDQTTAPVEPGAMKEPPPGSAEPVGASTGAVSEVERPRCTCRRAPMGSTHCKKCGHDLGCRRHNSTECRYAPDSPGDGAGGLSLSKVSGAERAAYRVVWDKGYTAGWQDAARCNVPNPTYQKNPYAAVEPEQLDPRLADALANPPGPRHARLVEPEQPAPLPAGEGQIAALRAEIVAALRKHACDGTHQQGYANQLLDRVADELEKKP